MSLIFAEGFDGYELGVQHIQLGYKWDILYPDTYEHIPEIMDTNPRQNGGKYLKAPLRTFYMQKNFAPELTGKLIMGFALNIHTISSPIIFNNGIRDVITINYNLDAILQLYRATINIRQNNIIQEIKKLFHCRLEVYPFFLKSISSNEKSKLSQEINQKIQIIKENVKERLQCKYQ